jgi:hypothetical protein
LHLLKTNLGNTSSFSLAAARASVLEYVPLNQILNVKIFFSMPPYIFFDI